MSGVFSDIEIERNREGGNIIIDPYDPDFVQGSSVDLRIGEWFYHCRSQSDKVYFNPYDERAITDYYRGPIRAQIHEEWCEENGRMLFRGIEHSARIIMLRPQERLLAHTVEFVGIKLRGTTKMQARSTVGRLGIEVCKDAGWGDPGFINRWTMEIKNNNDAHVPIVVGTPVSQLVFFHMDEVAQLYGSNRGNYQAGTEIEEIKRNWIPEHMVPKKLTYKTPLENVA